MEQSFAAGAESATEPTQGQTLAYSAVPYSGNREVADDDGNDGDPAVAVFMCKILTARLSPVLVHPA